MDTGADMTTLPGFMATELGISLKSLPKSRSQGIGKEPTRTWETRIWLKIGDTAFQAPCSFVASNKIPPLLGKAGVFDRFNLFFDNDRERLVLTPRREFRQG